MVPLLAGLPEDFYGDVWLWHTVVGDGVASNGLAAKYVVAMADANDPFGGRMQYFRWPCHCSVHRAIFCTKKAVFCVAALRGLLEAVIWDQLRPRRKRGRTQSAYSLPSRSEGRL